MTAPAPPLDLSTPGRYHVVGVGGPGMSALALVLVEMGHRISGSDVKESPVLDRLRAAGVEVHVGHDRALVEGVDAVTASTAIPASNIELAAARDRGILTLRRAGMLASICARARSVAVAGTHGKTTTTSMLAMMLTEAGWHPSYVIGGDVNEVGTGAQWSGGEWLVVEADESDGTFLELPLQATILTNVEVDHLEHFGTFEAIVSAFDDYLAGIPGPRVVGTDDEVAARLAARHDAVTYGTAAGARYRATDITREGGASMFVFAVDGARRGSVRVPLRGLHNVRNAVGALAMADQLGVPFDAAVAALARFGGVARRFEIRARHRGVTLVDDYAHLPTEIAAVIDAARDSGDDWRRIVAVFQPNRFRRMAVMSPEYRDAFTAADLSVITEIYPSGDAPIPGVTGRLVVDAVRDAHPGLDVRWIPKRAELIEFLAGELADGDVCISMGCGDVASLPTEVLALLRERESSA
jgi:UDP-N-acetylmuramate--alanine ligase